MARIYGKLRTIIEAIVTLANPRRRLTTTPYRRVIYCQKPAPFVSEDQLAKTEAVCLGTAKLPVVRLINGSLGHSGHHPSGLLRMHAQLNLKLSAPRQVRSLIY